MEHYCEYGRCNDHAVAVGQCCPCCPAHPQYLDYIVPLMKAAISQA